jgi:hypothetical protein
MVCDHAKVYVKKHMQCDIELHMGARSTMYIEK